MLKKTFNQIKDIFSRIYHFSIERSPKIQSRYRSTYGLIFTVVIIYLAVGAGVSWQIYKKDNRSNFIRRTLVLYPLPAVVVSGSYISIAEVYQQIDYIEHFGQKANQAVGAYGEIKQKVIERLIENVFIKTSAKHARLRVTDQEVKQALDKVYEDNGGEKPVADVLQSLYGMSVPAFKKLVTEQILKQKVKENALARIGVRHILVSDEKRAREVLDKIKNGGNFVELAKEFSEDNNSRDKGGELGWLNRGQLPKEVEEVAFKLKASELNQDLVKSEFGYHIVKVDGRNEGKVDLSFDEAVNQFKQKHRIIRFLK